MDAYFNYDNLEFRYDPFPIGVARGLIEAQTYEELNASWPDTGLFKYMPELGHKYALSQKFNRSQYHQFIRSNPVWRELHGWIKTDDFVYGVMNTLLEHHIDLGHSQRASSLRQWVKYAKSVVRGQAAHRRNRLSARFEFQMMPATGGHILPHTDTPAKIVTLVVSMVQPGEWDPNTGGGTDMNRPKDMRFVYNQLNRQARFEEMEVIDTFEFEPNQAVIFVKTFNSWHSVRPMTGTDPNKMRKTLIINIEVPK
ncbi:MAG: hypothetical protein J5I92_07755 [Thiogranum sp.]|nr:hypothetical protein [Thiogranum sp.]